jgi:hypothetical protein
VVAAIVAFGLAVGCCLVIRNQVQHRKTKPTKAESPGLKLQVNNRKKEPFAPRDEEFSPQGTERDPSQIVDV